MISDVVEPGQHLMAVRVEQGRDLEDLEPMEPMQLSEDSDEGRQLIEYSRL